MNSSEDSDRLGTDGGPARQSLLGRLVGWMVLLGGIACLTGFALGLLGRLHWTANVLAQLRPFYVVGLLLFGIILMALRGFCWRGFCLFIGGVLIGATLVPWYVGQEHPASERRLRILTFNLGGWNEAHAAVMEHLMASDADILILLEVRPHWAEVLAKMPGYPHRLVEPRSGNFGLAIISRLAPDRMNLRMWGAQGQLFPSIDLTISVDGAPLRIVGTHPPWPLGADCLAMQRDQLRALAASVRAGPEPAVLVAGDLNLTPWTDDFADFLARAGLRDGSRGFGYQPTWNYRSIPGLALPIDHSLVGGPATVVDRTVGPACGSDHRPVLVTVSW